MNKFPTALREELALLATVIHASRSIKGVFAQAGTTREEAVKSEATFCVGMALAIIMEAEKIE